MVIKGLDPKTAAHFPLLARAVTEPPVWYSCLSPKHICQSLSSVHPSVPPSVHLPTLPPMHAPMHLFTHCFRPCTRWPLCSLTSVTSPHVMETDQAMSPG